TTTYAYDDLNRLVTQTDPLQHATSQSYDALGNRTALIDANEAETLYGYDDLNRVRVITYTVDETVVYYDYDALGRRTVMTDAVGTTHYAFDELGRLTGVIDPFGQTVSYAYDARGNRTNVIYPDSQVVTYTYDAAGLLTGVTDWDDQTTTYEYDAANRLITVTLPNTVQTVYTYDDANRLIHLRHTRLSDNLLLADYEFTVDEVGNRVRVIEGLELPVDSQFAALPTMADAIVEAITGRRAPGLSAPTITGTFASLVNEWVSPVLTINETGQLKTAASHTENSHALIFDATALWPHLTPFVLDLGDPEEVAADPEVAEMAPAVAYNADDQEYLVVWDAYSDQYDVYARRVLSDGTPSGSSIAVVTDSGSQLSPKVAYGSGVYLVTWHDENSGAIQAQVLQASGTLSGTAFTVSSGSGNNAPAIDYNPEADEFLIAWVYDDEGDGDIHARRVSPDGQVLGSEINVADESGHDLQPALAHDAAGNYLVIFLHPDSSDFGVRSQRLTEGGSLSGTAFTVFDGDTSTSNQPDLAYDPDEDHYLVAWREAAGGAYDEIWTRLVSGEGDVLDTAQALDAQTSDYGPAVAYRKDNGAYLVVWSDRRDDHWDAYGRTVDGDGTPLAVPFSLEATEADQTWATVSKQGVAYELLVAYTDSGSGSADIYGERYAASGANFKASPRSGPGPLTVVLTDTSTATETITSRLWDFGDGITDTVTNPTHVYDEAGCFTVTLETWTDNSHSLMVKPNYIILAAQAGFTPQPAQGEVPLEVTFANTSYPTEIITAYLWDFGDGYTSTLTSPTHTYATYGLYGVTLTVFSTGGGQSVQTHMVAVGPEPGEAIEIATKWWAHEVRPAAAYNPDTQEYLVVWDDWNSEYDVTARRTTGVGLPLGETIPITTASGDQSESVVAYGDGIYLVVWSDASTIWGQRVTTAGELSGEAFTISDGGSSNTAPAIDYNPIAEEFLIVWNRSDESGDSLRAQRVTPEGVLTGSPLAVISSQAYNPAVAHTTSGAYLVVFVCPDSGDFGVCGQRLSSTGTLVGSAFSIYDDTSNSTLPDLAYDPDRDEYLAAWREALGEGSDPVYAQRLSSSGSLQGNVIDVEASSGDPYQPSVAYHAATRAYLVVWADNSGADWDIVARSVWADGSGLDNALLAVSAEDNQTYPAISRQGLSGAHFLLYTDDYNGSADIYGQRYLPPLARFSPSPKSGPAPLTVTFTERSTFPTTDSREWDFGDGNASTEADPSHEYLLPGQYTVVFTATWSSRTYTAAQVIEVTNPVQAQFTASPLQGSHPLTVTFSDQSQTSSGTISDWQWEFGDGATSDEQHPSHVYTATEQYTVRLIAGTGTYSATEVKSHYISVNPPYQAVITYTYDGLYRLTQADSTGALTYTFEYAYDAVGNRTTQTRTLGTTEVIVYAYDAANRLVEVDETTFTWDDRGNLLEDGSHFYTYDQANRLIGIESQYSLVTFDYNGDGVRLRQVIAGVPTTYTQDLAAPLPVVLQSKTDETDTRYVYALSTRPLAQHGTDWEYLLADALGSVRQIVAANGDVTLAESYEPYGSLLSSTGTASSVFGYSGEETDTSGLVFLRARYLQPTLGIFLARDPWRGDAMRSGSMNGWGYVEGNPILSTDPSGWEPEILSFTEIIKQCKELWFNGFNGIPDLRVSGDLCGMYLYYRNIRDKNDPDYGYHHDLLRDYMRIVSWNMSVIMGPNAGENLRHYLDAKGGVRDFSSEWYLREGGDPKDPVGQFIGSINTHTGEAADALAAQLKLSRKAFRTRTCSGRLSGVAVVDGGANYFLAPPHGSDVTYALGAYNLYATYYDGVQCDCDKKSYVAFSINDLYDFDSPNPQQPRMVPLMPLKTSIPFPWIDALSNEKETIPLRAKKFYSIVNWIEEIDWEAGTVIYHHNTEARQFLSLWPYSVGK
ncbi:partial tRNA nuclease WapA, partial [Anaerolineae bacterium]